MEVLPVFMATALICDFMQPQQIVLFALSESI
jgi:hypothetical protein